MSVDYQKNLQVAVRSNKPHKHGKVGNYINNTQLQVLTDPNIAGSRSNSTALSACFKDNSISAKYCAEALFNTVIAEGPENYNPDFPTGVNLGMVNSTETNTPNDKPASHGPNATYPTNKNVLNDPNRIASSEYDRTPSENYGYTIDNNPERDNRGFDGGETIGNIKDRYGAE